MIALAAQAVIDSPPAEGIVTPRVPWSALAPVLVLFVGSLLGVVVVSLLRRRVIPHLGSTLAVVVAGAALCTVVPLWHRVGSRGEGPISAVAGAVALDRYSLLITALICVSVILVALLSDGYLRREDLDGPELYLLMLMAAAGGSVMAAANDLVVLFVGFEILSIATYVLAAMHRRRLSSQEAGFKYLILGGTASAILLYGIALTYGATGSTSLVDISAFLGDHVITRDGLLLAGIGLMVVGLGFKVAAAPFHMWAPDIYQGAPSPVSAFMSSAVKIAAFAGLGRVLVTGLGSQQRLWGPIVFVLAVMSLIVGAVLAITQRNVKRMLAYSSINHAGFILVGVYVANERGIAAMLFYLAAYLVMTIGSFGVVTVVGGRGDGRHDLDDYRGMGGRRPGLALLFTILLLAQAGVPFTAGFVAKLGVIEAAATGSHWALAVVAMLSATISAFLYLRIISAMYFSEPAVEGPGPRIVVGRPAVVALGVAVVATLVLGIVPGFMTSLADRARPVLVLPGNR
ncbi:MAG: NADH-quinone oxidoreductase subunit N [Microthrixaceae bacterium]